MSNIIDFKTRVKSENHSGKSKNSESASVVDLGSLRDSMIREDRRQVKRTILTEFISVHAVVPGYGVMKVSLYDINKQGLSFDLEEGRGQYNSSEEVELRVYLNHQTYFRINAKVNHVTAIKDEGVVRHGCEFMADSINNEALNHFVGFLESVTAGLRKDNGDILVTKINS